MIALSLLPSLCPPGGSRVRKDLGSRARKDLYKSLRKLSAAKLWEETAKFDRLATQSAREQQVAVVRAVGVKFSNADDARKSAAQAWLLQLLTDDSEKIRRYAAAATSRIGGGDADELLLSLLRTGASVRERESAAAALADAGSHDAVASAVAILEGAPDAHIGPEQALRLRAVHARAQSSGAVSLDAAVPAAARAGLRLHLRCRRGLEAILADEVREHAERGGRLRVVEVRDACVAVEPVAADGALRLADLYQLRCFDTAGFVLLEGAEALDDDAVAAAIASEPCEALLRGLTDGDDPPLRYRLRFVDGAGADAGARSSAVKRVAEAAYALNPSILNDPNQALWYVDAVADGGRASVELRPRLRPNPRLDYQTATFYAGAHPPLAAAMARLARVPAAGGAAVVYDPFCGTAMELIETALASRAAGGGASGGGGLTLVGTDVDAAAIAVAEANLAKADLGVAHAFGVRDFRDALAADAPLPLAAGSVDAMITNPPLGRRVKVANLHALFADLFRLSAELLRPGGGRLVVINPLRAEPPDAATRRRLRLASQRTVDLGLRRACSVEVWERTGEE